MPQGVRESEALGGKSTTQDIRSRQEGEKGRHVDGDSVGRGHEEERCESEEDMISYGINSITWKSLVGVAGVPCASYSTHRAAEISHDGLGAEKAGVAQERFSRGHDSRSAGRGGVGSCDRGESRGGVDASEQLDPGGRGLRSQERSSNGNYVSEADGSKADAGCRGGANVAHFDGDRGARRDPTAVPRGETTAGAAEACVRSLAGSDGGESSSVRRSMGNGSVEGREQGGVLARDEPVPGSLRVSWFFDIMPAS